MYIGATKYIYEKYNVCWTSLWFLFSKPCFQLLTIKNCLWKSVIILKSRMHICVQIDMQTVSIFLWSNLSVFVCMASGDYVIHWKSTWSFEIILLVNIDLLRIYFGVRKSRTNLIFHRCLCSCLSTVYWIIHLFSTDLKFHFYLILNSHMYLGIFLNFLFFYIDSSICSGASITVLIIVAFKCFNILKG